MEERIDQEIKKLYFEQYKITKDQEEHLAMLAELRGRMDNYLLTLLRDRVTAFYKPQFDRVSMSIQLLEAVRDGKIAP